jgi:6-phosphogluconate dehydrogenase
MSEMSEQEIRENFQIISITVKWTADDIQRRRPHWSVEECEHFIDSSYQEIAAEAQEAGDRMIDSILEELGDEPQTN